MRNRTLALLAGISTLAAAILVFVLWPRAPRFQEDRALRAALQQIVGDYRKIIVLVDGAELLDDAGRNRSLAAGRIIFWREQDAVNQIGRLLTEQSGGAAAVRQFVQYVSKDPSLHDADKLAFLDIAEQAASANNQKSLAEPLRILLENLQGI